jgi:hypothetical protein
MSVAIGWQIYDVTGNPLLLGLVGLALFLPALSADPGHRAGRGPVPTAADHGDLPAGGTSLRAGLASCVRQCRRRTRSGRSSCFSSCWERRGPLSGRQDASLAPNLVPPEALSQCHHR